MESITYVQKEEALFTQIMIELLFHIYISEYYMKVSMFVCFKSR